MAEISLLYNVCSWFLCTLICHGLWLRKLAFPCTFTGDTAFSKMLTPSVLQFKPTLSSAVYTEPLPLIYTALHLLPQISAISLASAQLILLKAVYSATKWQLKLIHWLPSLIWQMCEKGMINHKPLFSLYIPR